MHQIQEKDIRMLPFLDPEWGRTEFRNFLEVPDATGFMTSKSFVIGQAIQDMLVIERFRFDKTEREMFFEELKQRFNVIHIDTTLSEEDHEKVIYIVNEEEFECYAQTSPAKAVKVRLTWRKK